MSDALMTLRDLTIGYPGQVVLSGLDLSIRDGAFTALLGANGSGKSTLLRTLAGLLKPLSGAIELNADQPVLAYVPQQESLDGNFLFTGHDVALMGVYNRLAPGRPVPASEIEHVRSCLRSAGAEGFAQRRFSRLSGGQKQRILIARALAMRPAVLLLDEPTSGVDTAATTAIMRTLADIHREEGLSIILVTHDFPLARQFAEDVIWLHGGVAEQGPPDRLLTAGHVAKRLELE